MAADPKYGTIYGNGYPSGRPYAVDFYYSDVADAALTFDSGTGASSTSLSFVSFNEPVIFHDISIDAGAAGTYAATNIRLTVNGQPAGMNVIRVKNHLNTLNNRPKINLKLLAGSRLGGIQKA